MRARVLVIEDEADLANSLGEHFRNAGYEVAVAVSGEDGLAQASQAPPDLVITDLVMPGLSGLDLIQQLHAARPRLPMILITGFGTTETAIEATRLGAYDYITKPFDWAELLMVAGKALDSSRVAPPTVEAPTGEVPAFGIVGTSAAMRRLYKDIGLAASAPMAVLIRGQTGTGKELVAQAIHRHSERAGEPFVAVNCTAIPETLLESELFGHERGAFTGAHAQHTGRFEQARQGTIFLDEIGDLSLGTQAKLLRVLQEKWFQRVGGTERVRLAARVVAATHQNLEAAMRHRQFREDLFYRLSALTITVPALDARRDDIPLLARHFLRRAEHEMGLSGSVMEGEAIEFLQKQAWPGNVRQLEHVIEHALLLARANPVTLAQVQEAYSSSRGPVEPEPETLDHYFSELLSHAETLQDAYARMISDMERELFTRAITLAQGNQAKAARWLGVTRTTMREKLIHFGLHAPREEPKDTGGKPDEPAES